MFLEHFRCYCGHSKMHIIPKKLNVFIVLREAPPLKHFLGHILGQIY